MPLHAGTVELPLPGNIHVWLVDSFIDQSEINLLAQLLSPTEKTKAAAFRFRADRDRFIVGRAVLRKLSSRYLGCETDEVHFGFNEFGKPFYENSTFLKFNLSHSDKLTVIGFVVNRELGIDIEKINPKYDFSDIARNVFSHDELRAVDSLGDEDRLARLYELWTRKEAFIKGLGFGLSLPVSLTKISVLTDQAVPDNPGTSAKQKNLQGWHIESFDTSPLFRAAVALHGNIENIAVSKWINT